MHGSGGATRVSSNHSPGIGRGGVPRPLAHEAEKGTVPTEWRGHMSALVTVHTSCHTAGTKGRRGSKNCEELFRGFIVIN
jgi:hypothetical protein